MTNITNDIEYNAVSNQPLNQEANELSDSLYNEYPNEIVRLQLYPVNQKITSELFKLCCLCVWILIGVGFIITAATRRCIYDC